MSSIEQMREAAEADLLTFIRLVAPKVLLGHVHEDLIEWWQRDDRKNHQLVLLPRAHQKSRLIAYRVVWELTRDPTHTIIYASATANLAEKQLYLIKQIMTSKVYRRYWPDMCHPEEGKRTRWTTEEIIVDHPARNDGVVRDPSVKAVGLTATITGMHCTIAVLDDVVVDKNAYTEEGRSKVRALYSQLASIEEPETQEWAVGTRYHPSDLYNDMLSMTEITYDEEGNPEDEVPVYEIFERVVEEDGEFLWPRQQHPTTSRWYGFNQKVLATTKAKYLDKRTVLCSVL